MNINRLIKELKKGNNPEKNLSSYSQLLLAEQQRLAYGKLLLSYTENYDMLTKAEEGPVADGLKTITGLLRTLCGGDMDFEKAVRSLDDCRNQMIARMCVLETYVHFLEVYEHIFNRLEYKFELPADIPSVEMMIQDAVNYISRPQDAQAVNSNIQDVLSELPVRLTTTKFLDLLHQSCLCYEGTRSDMADKFFESMKRCAHMPALKELDPSWSELYSVCAELEALDLSAVDQSLCRKLSEKITGCGRLLAEYLSNTLDLLDLINPLYIVLITTPYTISPLPEINQIKKLFAAYLKSVDGGNILDIDEDLLGGLSKIVENQQLYVGEAMLLEDVLPQVCQIYSTDIEAMMLNGIFGVLQTAERLGGADPGADLKKKGAYYVVGRSDIEAGIADLESAYKETFKMVSQPIRRAVISKTFDRIPVPFDSIDAVCEYIRSSFESCSELYERVACSQLIAQMKE